MVSAQALPDTQFACSAYADTIERNRCHARHSAIPLAIYLPTLLYYGEAEEISLICPLHCKSYFRS